MISFLISMIAAGLGLAGLIMAEPPIPTPFVALGAVVLALLNMMVIARRGR